MNSLFRKTFSRTFRTVAVVAAFATYTTGHADECTNWTTDHPQWLFCDDFESGDLGQWFDINGIRISTSGTGTHDGSHSAELPYAAGSEGAGWMWVKQLRPHSADADSQYVRWWQKWEDGFVFQNGSGDQKIFMLDALDPVNEWGQTANWKLYVHMADSGAGNNELVIDRHIMEGDQWQVYRQGGSKIAFDSGQWYCVEAEVAHNTPGVADGAVRVWIDNTMVLEEDNIKLRDDATSWNALQMNGWYAGSVPNAQSSWIDQVVVSSQRIGCSDSTKPNPPTDLQVQ